MDDRAWVVHRQNLGGGHFRIRLRPARAFAAEPGQFVMLRVTPGIDPLLRRPFSIHRMLEGGEFEVLFRVVGRGTRALGGVHVGDRVDALGPLGRGFRLEGSRPLIVGGGIGVAPLLFLAESFLEAGVRPKLLLGARTERDLLCQDDFSCLALPFAVATEDGSAGSPGLVTRLLRRELAEGTEGVSVYACGPLPMLRAVARLCRERDVPCQVSLEAHMACGIGACLGCVVPEPGGGYVRVCKEGPVFRAEEIDWGRFGEEAALASRGASGR